MKKVCKTCGEIVKPKKEIKGSVVAELLLWLFFIVPGIIYSIYRLSTQAVVCPICGSKELIPLDSSLGIKILKDSKGDLK